MSRLNQRQADVLLLVGKGFRNKEIAQQLGLAERLVKTCLSQLLLLFDASNRTELAGMLALESPPAAPPAGNPIQSDRAKQTDTPGERSTSG